jgi:glycosyltransferase involved in cell wall biosynthesis
MRTLVIADDYPWPVTSGSRIRLEIVLRGLGACGATDLFSILPSDRADIGPPPDVSGLARVATVGFDARGGSGWTRVVRAFRRSTPYGLSIGDGPEVQRVLTRFATGNYDLVWLFGIRPWVQVGRYLAAPTLLDLYDLNDRKIAARERLRPDVEPRGSGRLRQAAGRVVATEEVRRWRMLQRRAARQSDMTVVCSALDAGRAVAIGLPRVDVVPNGYPDVAEPLGRRSVGTPPTVLFLGTLRYPPNADASRFLVDNVVPILERLVPGVQVRLVGRAAPALSNLDRPPGVSLVGPVDDVSGELARADLVVVPLRFASGTRLKILEAFAHRIPVVSTAIGAEGLGAEDGVHLLVADSAPDLATACARLLEDEELRHSLTDNAHRHFLANFRSDVIERDVARVARAAAGPTTAPDS